MRLRERTRPPFVAPRRQVVARRIVDRSAGSYAAGMTLTRLALGLALVFPALATAQAPDERAPIHRAATDYLDAFYEGDTAKLVRSFRSDLYKMGIWRDTSGTYSISRMTYEQAMAYAKRQRGKSVNPAWPRTVRVV